VGSCVGAELVPGVDPGWGAGALGAEDWGAGDWGACAVPVWLGSPAGLGEPEGCCCGVPCCGGLFSGLLGVG
jgi:hypothetical protein